MSFEQALITTHEEVQNLLAECKLERDTITLNKAKEYIHILREIEGWVRSCRVELHPEELF